MSDEDIRSYLSRQTSRKQSLPARAPAMRVRRKPAPPKAETFKDFSATHLMCPTCRRAMPVRERLMLFLPDGALYDYLCTSCGTSVGTRKK